VAAVTIRRIERVIVVHMARRAWSRRWRHVRARQRKSGNAVIERGRSPTRRRMAIGTVGGGKRGPRSGVHRSIRLLPGGQMALRIPAIGRSNRQIVVVVDVAECACHVGVPSGQRKTRRTVVECRRCPTGSRMARRAIRDRKSRPGRRMDGVCGLLPSDQMALRIPAIGRSNRQIVVIVDMAERASHIRVAIGQEKTG